MERLHIEAEYELYKNKYEQSKSDYYYKEHKNEEWFKEKYDPQCILEINSQRSKFCQFKAEKFFEQLNEDVYIGSGKAVKLELREEDDLNQVEMALSSNEG